MRTTSTLKSQAISANTSAAPARPLAALLATVGYPIVDERLKADRAPVNFFILRFDDTALVAPYAPATWRMIARFDPADQFHKIYYVVPPADCTPYAMRVRALVRQRRRHLQFQPPENTLRYTL